MFPDYRETVPYQSLLACALTPAFSVTFGWLDSLLAKHGDCTQIVFHIHWQNAIYQKASSPLEAAQAVGEFARDLACFRAAGGRVIWTVHNLEPHENTYPDAEASLKHVIIAEACAVHVHSAATAEALAELGLPSGKIMLYPHPDMLAAYPNDITRSQARAYFALGDAAKVFTFFGMLRNYKGVDILRGAFRKLWLEKPGKVALIVAGQAENTKHRYLYADGVYRIPRYIEDSTVQYVFTAADFSVLPYRRISTSGVLMLGLAFGRPMILPKLPSLLEIVADRREALTFEPGDSEDLYKTLNFAFELGDAEYRALCGNALATGRRFTFSQLAGCLVRTLEAGHAAADPPRGAAHPAGQAA